MEPKEIERLLMTPTVQRRLGKYVLLGRLGHGGMGKIYLAYTPGPAGIEKLLVIKRLHSHLTGDPFLVDSFLDEARLSMALSHPHIVHTYDVGEVDGRYFMVMEFIDGQNLGVVLRAAKRAGVYPPGTLWAGFYLHVLEALHAAHIATDARGRALQIIHRDISPQNILVTYSGVPKLVDFGIAKAALRINETDAGVLKGKYAYMSPEQCAADVMDARSDVFSAGIVLWEMLVGKRLYKADNVVKSIDRIMHEPPISPTRVRGDCDPHLARVVVKALQKKPNERFSNAEDFRNALDEALRKSDARYRSSDMRKLMTELFAEVRRKQSEILQGCLAGTAESQPDGDVVTDGQSDSSPNLSHSHGEGSESASFKVVSLATDGGEEAPGTPSTHTRAERPSNMATSADQPPEHGDGEDENQHGKMSGQPTQANLGAGEMTKTQSAPNQAARLVLAFLGGAGLLALVAWFGQTPVPTIAETQAPVPILKKEPTGAPIQSAELFPPGDLPDEDLELPDEAMAAGNEETVDAQPAEPQTAETIARPARAQRARATPDANETNKNKGSAQPARPAPPTASPPSPRPVSTASAAAAPSFKKGPHGLLTLDTVPWASVYLGSVKLGETPLVKIAVPVGDLELLLVNEGAGIRQPYFLRVKEGENYRKKLKLD